MFSVYGVTGQVFRGTLEDMARVRALSKSRPARGIAKEGEELGVEPWPEPASRPGEDAIRAYRAMLPPELERGPLFHAEQIMQRQIISLDAEDEVAGAWKTLVGHRIHQAPVLTASNQLVGIVSERDLLTAIDIEAGRVVGTLNRRVRDVMTTPVVTAEPVTDLRRIATVMLDYRVDGVPITNPRGQMIGFVSRSDILRAVVTDPPLSLWR